MAAGTSTVFSYTATPEKCRVASSSVHDRSVPHSAGAPEGPNVTRQPALMSSGDGAAAGRAARAGGRAAAAGPVGNTITVDPYGARSRATVAPVSPRRAADRH